VTSAEQYLKVSGDYCGALNGLRWSTFEDALEYGDGKTFALTEEVAIFLEGFASGGRLIHFAFVLHLLHLLRRSPRFVMAGRLLRNAGAFGAVLCRAAPGATGAPRASDVLDRLRDPGKPIRWLIVSFHQTSPAADVPPLSPQEFEALVLRNLAAYTDEEQEEWMRHGRGPVKDAGAALARALPPPRTLAGALAALLDRPRLAGARPFVDRLIGALSLPPRRARPEIPVGGYADVATRGQPDQLLPSQFALDEWDFLRRHADGELLYFRREEPQARTRHELVVLIDQGVRTWGDVRLVLGAAVLARGRQAARGRQPFLIAATSGGPPLDPLTADAETLGRLVEASDLSANPGLALERLLEQPAAGSRDVVLLTHPRNLREEDVGAAARRAPAGTRVLALALDGHGAATLSELRHGVPVPVRQFRVDFSAAPPPPVAEAPVERPGAWAGDVEPVGFPFRFGTGGPLAAHLFDFDHEGTRLLTASRDAVLHVWHLDGSGWGELLPRAWQQGKLLTRVDNVVGVAGGFVVAGRDQQGSLVAAHYDFTGRTCKIHELRQAVVPSWKEGEVGLRYVRDRHVVLTRIRVAFPAHALDLSHGACFSSDDPAAPVRVRSAWDEAQRGWIPNRHLHCVNMPVGDAAQHLSPACYLRIEGGELCLSGVQPGWRPFVPRGDGRPSLEGCKLVRAECRGNILAVLVRDPRRKPAETLRLFLGPEGVPLAEYPATGHTGFALSPDGRLLAKQDGNGQVVVNNTVDGGLPVATTFAGTFSPCNHVLLGESWLLVRKGRAYYYLLNWEGDELEFERRNTRGRYPASRPLAQDLEALAFLTDTLGPRRVQVPGSPWGHYDSQRFLQAATCNATVVLDRFGHVVILDGHREVACMFLIFRDQLSGWLPDGTCFGPASATGEPPTTDVLVKFGRALARASNLEKRQ
jgi:hypothetical protein